MEGLSDQSVAAASTKIRLRDGRFLAYKEKGVSKSLSKYKIIIVHGFASSKDMHFSAPQEMIDELGIYFLLYDRAGYGESDPNPKRSVKSEAYDIQELADQMQIGSKFYVIGVSMGSYPIWGCLKYLSHRLAGVAFIVPVINYEWPSLAKNMMGMECRRRVVQCALWFAKHASLLLYWWLTQIWFPSSSTIGNNSLFFSNSDLQVLKKSSQFQMLSQEKIKEWDTFESLRGDFLTGFGKWEFDPMQLSNENESCSVHIWQGHEDKVVPFQLQRHVSAKLPWIKYHEAPHVGHLIVHDTKLCHSILTSLLLGDQDFII